MNQIDAGVYDVELGEIVTVQVIAEGIGNFATFVLDGVQLSPISTTPLTYNFRVIVGPGLSHFGFVTCFFPSDADEDAKYTVKLKAEADNGSTSGPFTGPIIRKVDSIERRGLTFDRA